MMFSITNNKHFKTFLNTFFILNGVLLLGVSSIDGLHLDELTISWFTDGSFLDIFRRTIIRGDSYPPLGHILIWSWKRVPCALTSTLCLKFPSVLIGMLTYYLMSRIYKERFENYTIFGLFSVLYFASYSTMFFLTDLKPHGIIQFLIVFFFYLEDKGNNFKYIPLIIASVMHYVVIFLIIAIAIREVFLDHKKFKISFFSLEIMKKTILYAIGPLVSFSYYLFSSYLGGSQLTKEVFNPFISIGKSILFIFGKDLFYLLVVVFTLLLVYFLILNIGDLKLATKNLFINADVFSILGIYIGFIVIIELISLTLRPISAARNLVIFSPFIFYITACFLYELIHSISKTKVSKKSYLSLVAVSIVLVWGLNMQYMLSSSSRNEENFSIPEAYLSYPTLVETSDLATKVSIQLRYDIENYDYTKKIYYKSNYFLENKYSDWVLFESSFSTYNIEEYKDLDESIFVHYPHEFNPPVNFISTIIFLEKNKYYCEELIFEKLLKQRNAICTKDF